MSNTEAFGGKARGDEVVPLLKKPSDNRPKMLSGQQQQGGLYTDAYWEHLDKQAEQAMQMSLGQ